MTRDELLKNHETICQEARDLMELKNRDYAGNGGTEPFANFLAARRWVSAPLSKDSSFGLLTNFLV